MKPTKTNFGRLLFGTAVLIILCSTAGCGEDPGLYEEEQLIFENGKEESKDKNLDLGSEESSNFSIWPASFFPFPCPVFPYYLEPVPVAVPISPFQAITEWVHPMYAVGMFGGSFPFWPNIFGPY